MPCPKSFNKSQCKRREKCIKDLKHRKGINPYAICTFRIKRRSK